MSFNEILNDINYYDRVMTEQIGIEVTSLIKRASWFPYKSGNLKFSATQGGMYDNTTYRIHFDSTVAPYVQYLEEGTAPHDIPGAFGKPVPFGIGGRFDGKFHPGSTKHKGFISEKSVNAIVEYIQTKYNGLVEIV